MEIPVAFPAVVRLSMGFPMADAIPVDFHNSGAPGK
jgi:hypothetical protein